VPAADSIPVILGLILAAWVTSFTALAILRLRPGLAARLAEVPGLMRFQLLVIGAMAVFVLVPAPIRGVIFGVLALRILHEVTRIHRGQWGRRRLATVVLFPVVPLVLFATVLGAKAAATLLLAFMLVEAFDSFSLVGGKLVGRTPLAPKLSPKKTVEGLLFGGAVMAGLCAALVPFAVLTPAQAGLAALVTVVFGTAGDLLASHGKRLAGVKDYPRLIQGQGGLLDMFDSWIVVAPVLAWTLDAFSG
jgi:CDP-diglyceride synthetase